MKDRIGIFQEKEKLAATPQSVRRGFGGGAAPSPAATRRGPSTPGMTRAISNDYLMPSGGGHGTMDDIRGTMKDIRLQRDTVRRVANCKHLV